MAELELVALGKSFGATVAVRQATLSVASGEMVALLGPSGCGKTTTLRMVAGFVDPTAGRIVLDGRDITRMPANRRDIGMVFQSYALFPHMTVQRNVEVGLRCQAAAEADVRRRVGAVLELVGLAPLAGRYPRQLSGGQQQRVALARVLVLRPKLLLFDEPLSNLDARLRVQMRGEIRQLQKTFGITALFVTHDQDEASAIADRIVVMNQGGIEQVGTPSDIYQNPATRFVADFIGTANVLDAVVTARDGDGCTLQAHGLALRGAGAGAVGQRGAVSVRPERIDFVDPAAPGAVAGTLALSRRVGGLMEYEVALAGGLRLVVHEQLRHSVPERAEGARVGLLMRPGDVRFLPADQTGSIEGDTRC
jgi:putative spermidine/putrescine transport system ATP-binding protein